MRADVARAVVHGPADVLDLLSQAADDLKSAGRINELAFAPGADTLSVDVTL